MTLETSNEMPRRLLYCLLMPPSKECLVGRKLVFEALNFPPFAPRRLFASSCGVRDVTKMRCLRFNYSESPEWP